MAHEIELEDEMDVFESLDALLRETEASPEFAEEALVGEAQSLIVSAMTRLNINRAELARRMGVSKARVSQMLSPACTNLTLRLLGRAGHALELPLKLVRADEVVARKSSSGAWCIGDPWIEPLWEAARVPIQDRVANENQKRDLNRAASFLLQAVPEAA